MGKVFGIVAVVLAVLAFLALLLYATSWSVRGWVAAARWDGRSTLECFGSTAMTLRGRTVDRMDASSPIINAAGNCDMEIVDCNFSGQRVLEAGGNAHVVVRNSKISGGLEVAGNVRMDLVASTLKVLPPSRAEVSGDARVAFRGSTLDGALEHHGNAIVSGTPEIDRQAALEAVSRRYGAHACDGVVACYEKSGAFGNISGRLIVDIDATGRAGAARYENGEAPAGVRDCLLALGRARIIQPFEGKAGEMICYYAGSLIPGATRMSTSPSFVYSE
jgi:hypothetical protein